MHVFVVFRVVFRRTASVILEDAAIDLVVFLARGGATTPVAPDGAAADDERRAVPCRADTWSGELAP